MTARKDVGKVGTHGKKGGKHGSCLRMEKARTHNILTREKKTWEAHALGSLKKFSRPEKRRKPSENIRGRNRSVEKRTKTKSKR